MSASTPRPWKLEEAYATEHGRVLAHPYILDGRGVNVAAVLYGNTRGEVLTEDERLKIARLIVAAVNSFDDMRGLLERVADAHGEVKVPRVACVTCEARALLARLDKEMK